MARYINQLQWAAVYSKAWTRVLGAVERGELSPDAMDTVDNMPLLHVAIKSGSCVLVQRLLQLGADPDIRVFPFTTTTAMHVAVSSPMSPVTMLALCEMLPRSQFWCSNTPDECAGFPLSWFVNLVLIHGGSTRPRRKFYGVLDFVVEHSLCRDCCAPAGNCCPAAKTLQFYVEHEYTAEAAEVGLAVQRVRAAQQQRRWSPQRAAWVGAVATAAAPYDDSNPTL
jgi:hypothetical protein